MRAPAGSSPSTKKKGQSSILSFFKRPKAGAASNSKSETPSKSTQSVSAVLPSEAVGGIQSLSNREASHTSSGGKGDRDPARSSDVNGDTALKRNLFEDADAGENAEKPVVGKRRSEPSTDTPRATKRVRRTRPVKRIVESDSDDGEGRNDDNASDASFKLGDEDDAVPVSDADDYVMDVDCEDPDVESSSVLDSSSDRPLSLVGLDLPALARRGKDAAVGSAEIPSIPAALSQGREAAREKLAIVDVRTKGKKVAEEGEWVELHPWARDIRDSKKRRPGEPGYDPTTLYIPPGEFRNTGKGALTPGQKQYWAMKMKHYDVVLFVKKGRFYELYDLDADMVHKEINLTYSKCSGTEMHVVGIPERNFNRHSSKLLDRGYKIGRVEQAETANGMEQRKADTKGAKPAVIERVLVRILTKATVTDEAMLPDHHPRYVFSILEDNCSSALDETNVLSSSAQNGMRRRVEDEKVKVGICYVDVACGSVTMREFTDDFRRSETERVLTVLRPHEVLLKKEDISKVTLKLLQWSTNMSGGQILELFENGLPEMTSDWLSKYLGRKDTQETYASVSNYVSSKTLARKAFGAVANYLKGLMIDKETLSLGNYSLIPDVRTHEGCVSKDAIATVRDAPKPEASTVTCETSLTGVRMDSTTLASLEVLTGSGDGSENGSILSVIDRACTQRGRRLLKRWLSAPLVNSDEIEDRLNAIDALLELDAKLDDDILSAISTKLASGRDIERALPRLHEHVVGQQSAMMFDNANKRQVKEFVKVLRTLESTLQVVDQARMALSTIQCTSKRLSWVVSTEGGIPPDAWDHLRYFFEDAFDFKAAEESGDVIPAPGTAPDYDKRKQEVQDVEDELDDMLNYWRRKLGLSAAKFVHRNAEKYQLEFSASGIKGRVPKEFELVSQTKVLKRFYTPSLRQLIKKHVGATEAFEQAGKRVARDIVARFNQHYNTWSAIGKCSAELDALIGLARASQGDGTGPMCRPKVLPNSYPSPIFHAKQLRHPVLARKSTSFIANDVLLGGEEPNIAILTGPNAGGKSTLSRQVAVCALLAQVGCYAPAEKLTFRPFEDVFVRMGASDDISRGQSTFMVEMEEVSNILNNATSKSLTILDEVGRGTSSFDGYSVAFATLKHLVTDRGCIGVFSTHYSMLGHDIGAECNEQERKNVGMYEMAASVDEKQKHITFLYKFQKGISAHSRGICCARLAGIPAQIADNAEVAAVQFEKNMTERLSCSSFQSAMRTLSQDEKSIVDNCGET